MMARRLASSPQEMDAFMMLQDRLHRFMETLIQNKEMIEHLLK